MGSLPPVFIEFLGKSTGVKMALSDIKAETKKASAEGESGFTKFGKLGAAAIMGLGVAAGAVAVKTVQMASEFQTQMTRLQTAAGLTSEDIKKAGYTTDSLNQKVLQLGTQVGMTGTQMAEALYHPISAGLDLKSSLEVVKYAAEEAKISGSSLEDTTYSLSSVMKAFNVPAQGAKQTMADLNAIVGQGDMRFQDFNESVKNWAPTAAQMGISINSMGAGLAYLTDRGNSAEVASTRLTMGISMMTTPSAKATAMLKGLGVASTDVQASSDAMKKAMEKAGITQNQLAEDLKKPNGLYVALNHLKTSLKAAGVSGTEADSVLSKIFGGGRSDKAVMSLMQNLDGLKTKYQDISKQANGSSFDKAWAKTQQTFSFQMEKMKAALENLGIAVGTKLLPPVTRIVGILANFASMLLKHRTIASGLAIVIGGALVLAIVAATVAFWGFITSAAVLQAIPWVAAITAIIIVIVLLATHWRQVWHFIESVAKTVAHAVVAAWHWIASAAVTVWHAITSFVVSAWNDIAGFFSSAWHDVADPVVRAWHWVSDQTVSAWHAIVGFLSSAWHAIVDPLVQAWHWIESVTTEVWNAIAGFFKKWWPLLLTIFAAPIAILMAAWNHFHTAVFNAARTVWGAITGFFRATWNLIKSIASAVWNAVADAVIASVKFMWRGLQIEWHWILDGLNAIWDAIKKAAAVVWEVIRLVIVRPMEDAWHGLEVIWNTVSRWLESAWHGIEAIARWVWSLIKASMINPLTEAWHTITRVVGQIASAISDGLQSAWHAVENVGSWFLSIGESIVSGIINGVENAASSLFDSLKNLAGDALNAAKSFLGINSPSRVFASVVGTAIPEGIAKGIDDNAHIAHGAVRRMAGDLISAGTYSGLGVGSPTLAGFGPSSASGGGITVNMTVNGHVMTERDLRDFIQEQFLQMAGRNPGTWPAYRK